MKKIKKSTIESILYLYIIICPILDYISFIFRNTLVTSISPSTIIRPIFILAVSLYIFITDKKQRIILVIAGFVYGLYSAVHLHIFTLVKNGSSYSGVTHELQYLVHYTFMALTLYSYIYIFGKSKNTDKLKNSILISMSIYILSIFVTIITKTSSFTYPLEGIGYKGWFESGNSLSAIFVLGMFILINMLANKKQEKKIRIYIAVIIVLVGIYLTTFIGTKVGLFGFAIVIAMFGIAHIIYNIINKKRVRETLIISGIISVLAIATYLIVFNVSTSETAERIKKLQEMSNELVDEETNEKVHITGDLYKIKEEIENGTLEQSYMNEAQQQAVITLNQIATEKNLSVKQMRSLQLIYNIELANNQSSLLYRLFGNGYMCQYREMILENEIMAILINFGLFGFILYLMPFIMVYGYAIFKGIRYIKKVDVEYIMLIAGGGMAFALSLLSGYIFFSVSTTMIIVLINVLLYMKTKEMK